MVRFCFLFVVVLVYFGGGGGGGRVGMDDKHDRNSDL